MKARFIDKYICCLVTDNKIMNYYDDTYTNNLNKAIDYANDIYNDLCDTVCFVCDDALNSKVCVLNKRTLEYVYAIDF